MHAVSLIQAMVWECYFCTCTCVYLLCASVLVQQYCVELQFVNDKLGSAVSRAGATTLRGTWVRWPGGSTSLQSNATSTTRSKAWSRSFHWRICRGTWHATWRPLTRSCLSWSNEHFYVLCGRRLWFRTSLRPHSNRPSTGTVARRWIPHLTAITVRWAYLYLRYSDNC